MARSVTKAGFEFVVKGAAGATADIKKIENAAQKMDLAFAKTIATGGKLGPALTGALGGALPGIGALQLGVVGVAAGLADKLIPAVANVVGSITGLNTVVETASKAWANYVVEFEKAYKISLDDEALKEETLRRAYRIIEQNKAIAKEEEKLNARKLRSAILAENARKSTEKAAEDEQKKALAAEEKRQEEALKRRQDSLKAAAAFQKVLSDYTESQNAESLASTEQAHADYQASRLQEAADAEKAFQALMKLEADRENELLEAKLEWQAELKAKAREEELQDIQRLTGGLQILTQASADYARAVVSGQQTAGEAFESVSRQVLASVVNMIALEIQARAVSAAVKAFDGSMGLAAVAGPAAIAIAAGAAAAAFSTAIAYKSQLPHLATGGYIRGGVPGRDSVPAVLQPGEFVIPARETALLQSMMGRGGAGKGTTIVINQLVPDSKAMANLVRDQLIPAQRRLQRLGAR